MKPIDDLLAEIARKHLDSLDFHDVALWGVKDALLAAYKAGQRAVGVPPARAAAPPPIAVVTVRAGCVEAVEATLPLRVILEDWDCEDRLTGKKPYRAELPATGTLSAAKAARCLRYL
jgi:hypothetical protein